MSTTSKTWNPTKVQHLFRHRTGTYYARLTIGGKRTWRSLKTSNLGIAKAELEALQSTAAHHDELLGSGQTVSEHMTGADAIRLRLEQIASDASLKPSSRKYFGEVIAALRKSWPDFERLELRKVTEEECQAWAGRVRPAISSTRFNNSVGMLRQLFQIAIRKGARRTNPAAELKKAKVRGKNLSGRLPSRAQFSQWVSAIRNAGGRFSAGCADLVEFLAYTGLRITEAKWVLWKHCDFDRGEITVLGAPETGTKNGDQRRVPMIAECRRLLHGLRSGESPEPESKAMIVHEAQKAMDRAARQIGMERITHHDLRHFFATTCIESGVDIPTVSRWLGHKDGGALALRVYGHLRNEHSQAAAARVTFAV